MADTEMEGGPSKPSTSESAPEGAPPKKKRTRTLTTPHQAAVLHALLAQVRRVPHPNVFQRTLMRSLVVAVSDNPDARGGGEVHWVECSQSPGTPPPLSPVCREYSPSLLVIKIWFQASRVMSRARCSY